MFLGYSATAGPSYSQISELALYANHYEWLAHSEACLAMGVTFIPLVMESLYGWSEEQ